MVYDLLLQGGEVLDSGAGIRGRLDIGISAGRVARIAPGIEAREARRVIHVAGKLVAPGLIDIHRHIAEGMTAIGIHPDVAGVLSGVCTVVDAGSCGSHTFGGFAKFVAAHARTRVLSMVHIVRTGLASMPELRGREDLDPEGVVRTIESHRAVALGVKLRLVGAGVQGVGAEAVREARRAARETGTRLMLHVGDPEKQVAAAVTRAGLGLLEPGDIVTHFFTGQQANLLDPNGRPWPEVAEAARRGVFMDCAHGRGNFSFDAARRLLDQGVRPHCLSTDLTVPGRYGVVGSLTETMSKAMALGFSLEEAVRMTTANPAQALGMADTLGSLAEGREADISVLELVEGEFLFRDTMGGTLKGDKALAPALTIRAGELVPLDWGPRPWGWLPEAGLALDP
jgi:dihydroorotase